MRQFFQTVSALMSQLLRGCVEISLEEFAMFFEEYSCGNAYEGEYTMLSGLSVEALHHPITIFVASTSQLNVFNLNI